MVAVHTLQRDARERAWREEHPLLGVHPKSLCCPLPDPSQDRILQILEVPYPRELSQVLLETALPKGFRGRHRLRDGNTAFLRTCRRWMLLARSGKSQRARLPPQFLEIAEVAF